MQAEVAQPEQSGIELSDQDLQSFKEGTQSRLYQKLGAHVAIRDGVEGVHFAVWAPNAESVSVIGDFNRWEKDAHPLSGSDASGIWAGFIPRMREAASYKYHVASRHNGYSADKSDPFGFCHETPPQAASLVWDLTYEWSDQSWMLERAERFSLKRPISIYEMHLGSWRRAVEEPNRFLTYRELASPLADYLEKMRFTHVEFLPVMEHPFYGSHGYQTTGYFAPTSRYGRSQDLMFLIDYLHQRGFGVILDWVPCDFPTDENGLAYFDGTHLYEYADPRLRLQRDRGTYVFDYGKGEVQSFLLSSAFFWLDKYHADGLRAVGVASMLYLDYSRGPGEWVANRFGGKENLEAIEFLRRLNVSVYQRYPDVQTIAEESTAWPAVSRPTYIGGLGFGFKWDVGFMHSTLKFFNQDPILRKYHYDGLTSRALHAFTENFILPFSHDQLVYGKGALLDKMPGDDWQKFANLRLLLGYMYFQPGKKLIFMGAEFGESREWDHDSSLDWHLLSQPLHAGVQRWMADLNQLYRQEPSLHEGDAAASGFEWVDFHDTDQTTLSWLRWTSDRKTPCLAIFNFTPVLRRNYRVGVPVHGFWKELLNSDAKDYGGSGQGNFGGIESVPFGWHGRPVALSITLPPLSCVVFKPEGATL
jgi:1,4-alpha-glucan branching enzyme